MSAVERFPRMAISLFLASVHFPPFQQHGRYRGSLSSCRQLKEFTGAAPQPSLRKWCISMWKLLQQLPTVTLAMSCNFNETMVESMASSAVKLERFNIRPASGRTSNWFVTKSMELIGSNSRCSWATSLDSVVNTIAGFFSVRVLCLCLHHTLLAASRCL